MRAISLWQPWASAIAVGAKRVETRHWSTPYRGPLAIHAAKRKNINELIYHSATWGWCGALRPLGLTMGGNEKLWDLLPFGAIVATCELTDCRPTDSFTGAEIDMPRRPEGEKSDIYCWTERHMGNFELGRFGWILENIQPTRWPIPFKGAQGFFNVPDSLFEKPLTVAQQYANREQHGHFGAGHS